MNAPARSSARASSPRTARASTEALIGAFGALVADVADALAERLAPRLERPAAPVLLDRRGLAAALQCGVDTVDRLRREGCPELRVGDAPRYELGQVLEWLRTRGTG